MGLIFDQNIARLYDLWYFSQQGRKIDRSIAKLISTFLQPRHGERALDIGCGVGNHLLLLNRLGLNVSGIDASPYMIKRSRERLGQRYTLKVGMAEDLPFDDNEFDFTFLINTLEFLDSPVQALREAGRVTNKKVFVGVMNSLSWNGMFDRIQGYFGETLFSNARFYNLWQLKALMQKAYGKAPLAWGCIQTPPYLMTNFNPLSKVMMIPNDYSPFGSFIGITATMKYTVKTDNLPLKIRMKKKSLIPDRPLNYDNIKKKVL